MRTRGKTWMLLCSIVIACAGAQWPAEQIPHVETTVVQSGELIHSRVLTGIVQYEQKQYIVSPRNGLVRKIYAAAGQKVAPQEVLIRLDTTAQESILTQIYKQQFDRLSAMQAYENVAQTLLMQSQNAYEKGLAAAVTAVEASSIRALCNGVVDTWYVREGQLVQEGMIVGSIRGTGLQLIATDGFADAKPGMFAFSSEYPDQVFELMQISAAEEKGMQTLLFELPETMASAVRPGNHVQLELMTANETADALIPLSAIDEDGKVWYIEDGCVYNRELEQSAQYNRLYSKADDWWKGKTIVINPDRYALEKGMYVRGKE